MKIRHNYRTDPFRTDPFTAYVSGFESTYGIDHTIHFCPTFFKSSNTPRADIYLHEASHLFANTDDLRLGGGKPWEKNPNDAYWIQPLGTTDPFVYFQGFVHVFTANFGN
jgi:hypothetical protein